MHYYYCERGESKCPIFFFWVLACTSGSGCGSKLNTAWGMADKCTGSVKTNKQTKIKEQNRPGHVSALQCNRSDSCVATHPLSRASPCDDAFKLQAVCLCWISVTNPVTHTHTESWPWARQRGNRAHPCYIHCRSKTSRLKDAIFRSLLTWGKKKRKTATFVSVKHWVNFLIIQEKIIVFIDFQVSLVFISVLMKKQSVLEAHMLD